MAGKSRQSWLGDVYIRLSVGGGFLLLASHTVGSGRVKETAAAFLASAVATILAADSTTEAVHQAREEQTDTRGPHESESLDTELGVLAVAVESVASLHIDSTRYRVSLEILVVKVGG